MQANQSQFQFIVVGLPQDAFFLQRWSGEMKLSEDYQLQLYVAATEEFDVDTLINQRAKLIINNLNNNVYLHGLITASHFLGSSNEGKYFSYLFFLNSNLYSLKQRQSTQIFLNKTIPDIVKEILLAANWSPTSFVFKLRNQYSKKKIIMQFNEVDLTFMERLLSQTGLFYFFWQQADSAQLWILDTIADLPYYAEEPLPFFTENGANKNQDCIYYFSEEINSLPQQLQLKNNNYENANLDLTVMTHNQTAVAGLGNSYLYGNSYEDFVTGEKFADYCMQALACRRQLFVAKTDCRDLQLGQQFTLTNHPQKEFNIAYRVIGIALRGNQLAQWATENTDKTYEAIVTLIKTTLPFRVFPQIPEPFYHILPAIVEALENNSQQPYLDEQGRYHIRFPFDQSNHAAGQASCAVPLLQHFGGQPTQDQLATGWHFPLRAGTQVAVGFMQGDVNQPVILGVIHNPENPTTTSSLNHTQNVIRTFAGNELTFDDHVGNPFAMLATKNHKNQLLLAATPDDHQIKLIAAEGAIKTYAKQLLHLVTGDSYLQNTAGNHTLNVQNNHALLTKNGSITHQSGNNLQLNAQRHLQMHAQNNIQMQSAKNIAITAGNQLSTQIQNGDLQLQANAGKITIQTQKHALIHSQGNNITIGQPAGGIVCTPEGDVYLYGPNIYFEAEEINIFGTGTINTQQSSYQYQPPVQINNQDANNDKNETNDEEFKLFVATVYGEASGCSETAWKAVGSVIINRLSCKEYRKYKTATEIIENTKFQAYDDQSPNFVMAKSYLDKISRTKPPEIDKMIAALKPIYYNHTTSTDADHYYSPNAQHRGHQKNRNKYHDDTPNWVRRGLQHGTYVIVNVIGLNQITDDFIFLKTVK